MYELPPPRTTGPETDIARVEPGPRAHFAPSSTTLATRAVKSGTDKPRHEILVDVDDVALGHHTVQRWNAPAEWTRSTHDTHEALISPEDFARAREQMRVGRNRPAIRKAHRSPHPYVPRGLLSCGICGRRTAGHHVRDELRCRCRYLAEYALTNALEHPRSVYVSDEPIVEALDAWLAQLFDPEHLDDTVAALTAASAPGDSDLAILEAARKQIANCDARLARYRSALEAGADPTTVARWIAEVKGERLAAEGALLATPSPQSITTEELEQLVAKLGDIEHVLTTADSILKAQVYAELGIRITYRPADHLVSVSACPGRWSKVRVGGALQTLSTRDPSEA